MGTRLTLSRGAHAGPSSLRTDVVVRLRDPIVVVLAIVALLLGFVVATLL